MGSRRRKFPVANAGAAHGSPSRYRFHHFLLTELHSAYVSVASVESTYPLAIPAARILHDCLDPAMWAGYQNIIRAARAAARRLREARL